MRNRWVVWTVRAVFAGATVLLVFSFATARLVRSEELPVKCPPPQPGVAPGCKVLFLSPAEEQLLMADRGILQTAEQGRPLDLGAAINYFRRKILTAPSGQQEASPPADPEKK